MLDRMSGQVWQRGICRLLQNCQRLRVFHVGVRIEQTEQQLVIAVGREAVLNVEVGCDGLRVEAVEADYLLPRLFIAGDGIGACERGDPLSKSARGSEAVIEALAIVVAWIVVIPAAEVLAWRRHAGHLPKRLEQAIFTERHQDSMRGHELRLMQIAGHEHVAITKLGEHGGG